MRIRKRNNFIGIAIAIDKHQRLKKFLDRGYKVQDVIDIVFLIFIFEITISIPTKTRKVK